MCLLCSCPLGLVWDGLDVDSFACFGGAQAAEGEDAVGVVLRCERGCFERLPVLREAHGPAHLLRAEKGACLRVEAEEQHRRRIGTSVDALPGAMSGATERRSRVARFGEAAAAVEGHQRLERRWNVRRRIQSRDGDDPAALDAVAVRQRARELSLRALADVDYLDGSVLDL